MELDNSPFTPDDESVPVDGVPNPVSQLKLLPGLQAGAPKPWSESDRDIVREFYPHGGAPACAPRLSTHRTHRAISLVAKRLGVSRHNTDRLLGSPSLELQPAPQSSTRPHLRKLRPLFGDPQVDKVYRDARAMLAGGGFFRLVTKSKREDGGISTTICNLWRIERTARGALRLYERDLGSGDWRKTLKVSVLPPIPMFPVRMAKGVHWWADVVCVVVCKVLEASGFSALPGAKEIRPELLRFRVNSSPTGRMVTSLLRRYTGILEKSYTGESSIKGIALKAPSMNAGAKALRAALFEYLDKPLVSALASMQNRVYSLSEYLFYHRHRDAILRVATERRNLLPLLPHINPRHWKRDDLFSRDLWVTKPGNPAFIQRRGFLASGINERPFQGFLSAGGFRWLASAPSTVVGSWAQFKDVVVLEDIAKANISDRLPAVFWIALFHASTGFRIIGLGGTTHVQSLYRAFALHCRDLWKSEGYGALKNFLIESYGQLSDTADWLSAEGIAQGHPNRNSTWASLRRRSAQWHDRINAEVAAKRLQLEATTWACRIGEVEVSGVKFLPLTNALSVIHEGHRQHHCVSNYVPHCISGGYRLFAAEAHDGTRSTLGIYRDRSGRWNVDQHRGVCNVQVGPAAAAAGRALAERYNDQVLDEGEATSARGT